MLESSIQELLLWLIDLCCLEFSAASTIIATANPIVQNVKNYKKKFEFLICDFISLKYGDRIWTNITYQYIEMSSSIQILAWGYAKDSFRVYYAGNPIENASSTTFQVLRDGYAKDDWKAYYLGRKVEDSSSTTFQVLRDGYAKDDWRAYYVGRKMDGVSIMSFEILGQGMAKDAFSTYYCGAKLKR